MSSFFFHFQAVFPRSSNNGRVFFCKTPPVQHSPNEERIQLAQVFKLYVIRYYMPKIDLATLSFTQCSAESAVLLLSEFRPRGVVGYISLWIMLGMVFVWIILLLYTMHVCLEDHNNIWYFWGIRDFHGFKGWGNRPNVLYLFAETRVAPDSCKPDKI